MEKKTVGHIPFRMCVGCRSMFEKHELIRIISENEQTVIDFKQNKLCRGVYICKNEACINKAKKRRAISQAFKRQTADEFYEELIDYAKG